MKNSMLTKNKKYPIITKARREHFGAIMFRERPAFAAYVNHAYADAYNVPQAEGAIMQNGVFTAPLDAHLALTTRCNMYCNGCYSTKLGDEPRDISIDMAKAIIDKLSGLGVFSLSFGGGEPTLHPQLFDIAAYAREKQILPNMTTNGLTMDEQFAKKCDVFGVVHFSIHNLKDMDHIFHAIHMYKKITKKKPGLNLLLTCGILPHLDAILSKARKAGVNKVLLLRYKVTSKNADVQGLRADKELEQLPKILKNLNWANKRLMFLVQCSLFEILAESGFSNFKTYFKHDSNGCQGGNAFIAIDINGMYKPCSFWYETFGSVLDMTFDSWANCPKLTEFRNMRKGQECAVCEFEEICMGGCRLLY